MKRFIVVSLVLLAGIFAGVVLEKQYPLPFPDRGHRLFGVNGKNAYTAIEQIFSKEGKLGKSWAFDAGPTHQVVMTDNMTVLAWFDKDAENLPKNAISLAVDDPKLSALRASKILGLYGYTADIHEPMKDMPPNSLVLVKTNALLGGAIVFRKTWWRMPTPKTR